MKFVNIIALIMIVIISLSNASKIKRRNNRDDGDGSWAEGFNCPSLFIGETNVGPVKILAAKIKEGEGVYKYGVKLEFKNNKGPDDFHKVQGFLTRTKTETGYDYMMYYRKMSQAKFINPWADYKNIIGQIANEKGEQVTYKLNLPYKTFGWFITDDEGNDLANIFNINAGKRNQRVNSAKFTLNKNWQNYRDAKSFYTALTTNKEAYEKLMKDEEAKLTGLKSGLDSKKQAATDAETAVNTAKKEFLEAEKALSDLLTKDLSIKSEIGTIKQSRDELSGKVSDIAATKDSLSKKVAAAKSHLEKEFDKLKNYAPQRKVDIDNAQKALFESKKDDYQKSINLVYP